MVDSKGKGKRGSNVTLDEDLYFTRVLCELQIFRTNSEHVRSVHGTQSLSSILSRGTYQSRSGQLLVPDSLGQTQQKLTFLLWMSLLVDSYSIPDT